MGNVSVYCQILSHVVLGEKRERDQIFSEQRCQRKERWPGPTGSTQCRPLSRGWGNPGDILGVISHPHHQIDPMDLYVCVKKKKAPLSSSPDVMSPPHSGMVITKG